MMQGGTRKRRLQMTTMDLVTAVHARIPSLSVLLNNFAAATEIGVMLISTQKWPPTVGGAEARARSGQTRSAERLGRREG